MYFSYLRRAFFCSIFILLARVAYATVEVQILGIDGELLNNAKASLSLSSALIDRTPSRAQIRRLAEKGVGEIQQSLRPFGYYQATVTQSMHNKKRRTVIQYDVHVGQPILVHDISSQITGSGATDSMLLAEFQTAPFHEGSILRQDNYERYKNNVIQVARDRGYLDARFTTHRITINTTVRQADITLVFETGILYRLGTLSILRNPYADDFVKRFLPFQTGDTYRAAVLRTTQDEMSATHFFESVALIPKINQRHAGQLPVDIDLMASSRYRADFGLGYGTDTGYRARLAGHMERITHHANALRVQGKLSQYKTQYSLAYVMPGHDPIHQETTISAAYIDDMPPGSVVDSISRQISISYQTGDAAKNHRLTSKLTAQNDRFLSTTQLDEVNLLLGSLQWQWIRADNRIITDNGYAFDLQTRGAHTALLSSTAFAQMIAYGKYIVSPSAPWRILSRAKVGLTFEKNIDDVPPALRFFAGGDNSVRGYAYQSLGPRTVTANGRETTVGGAHVVEASIELERKIIDKWRVALFYDVGNAFNRFNTAVQHGAGVGIRWQSPLGLVRLDLASALSRSHQPLRLHFNFGPDL